MRGNRALHAEVAETARELHRRGWVANHDGNVTARDGQVFVATPTATSKRKVTDHGLLEVDAKGAPIGAGKVFGEIGLHLAIYARRPDVGAVVHAHPPSATAIACSPANPIERPFIAEALVSLGPAIPKLAYATPGEAAVAALAPWAELVDAALLGNHGVIAWGASCEQALLRLELVEHLATIALRAQPLGGVVPLPAGDYPALLAARAKANIGRVADRAVELAQRLGAIAPPAAATPAASGAGPRPVVACAPAPHSDVPTIAPGGSRPDVAAIVREEIVRALRDQR
jgi:L-fuculose-phosphate aldolase